MDHTTNPAPPTDDDRKSLATLARIDGTPFFSAAAQRHHALERITKNPVHPRQRHEPGKTIRIVQLPLWFGHVRD